MAQNVYRSEDTRDIAVTALTMIREHEKTCAERWKIVVRSNFVMIGVLLTVLGVLIQAQFFSSWIPV